MRWFRRQRPLCPPLDDHGHHSGEGFGLWHVAAYLPDGREGEVLDLLAANGIEVYRAWPVRRDGEPVKDATSRIREQIARCEAAAGSQP